jgi:hypothetical protein
MIYYNLLAANMILCYILSRVFFFKWRKAQIIVFSVTLLISIIGCITSSVSFIYLISGVFSYLSTASTLFMLIILISQFSKNVKYTYEYTSIAFLILLVPFYLSFAVSSYYLYDIGYNPYIIAIFVYIYALILVAYSKKFLLFNIIIIISSLLFFTSILQGNIWNYLADPILVIICLIELIIVFVNKRFKNTNNNNMVLVSY